MTDLIIRRTSNVMKCRSDRLIKWQRDKETNPWIVESQYNGLPNQRIEKSNGVATLMTDERIEKLYERWNRRHSDPDGALHSFNLHAIQSVPIIMVFFWGRHWEVCVICSNIEVPNLVSSRPPWCKLIFIVSVEAWGVEYYRQVSCDIG